MSTFLTSAQHFDGTGCFPLIQPFFNGTTSVSGNEAMTLEMCYNTCAIPGSGYQFFGLFSTFDPPAGQGDGCECATAISGFPSALPSADCNTPCAGNANEMCGGVNGNNSQITVYEIIGASLLVPGWLNAGCHTDAPWPNNALGTDGVAITNDTAPWLLTPQSCAIYCSEYVYFSVENGDACYCGNTLVLTPTPTNIGEPAEPTSCDWACAGDPGAQCGAASFMNLYSNSAFPQYATTVLSVSTTTAGPEIGTTETTVAASPTSTSVFIPGISAPIPVDNGTIWYSYSGCHTITNEPFPTSDNSTLGMTVTLCLSFCASSYPAFNYSVLSGTDCYCSNDLSVNGATVSNLTDSECMTPCPGNPSEACAGSSLPIRKRKPGPKLYTLSPAAIYQIVAAPVVPSSTSSMSSMSTNSGGDALSTSTIYETDIITITSCAPEITNCPARTHTTSTPTGIVVYSEEVASNSTTWVPVTTMPWAPYMTMPGPSITPAGGFALPSAWPTYPYPSHSAISAAFRSGISLAWSSVAFLGSMVLAVFWF